MSEQEAATQAEQAPQAEDAQELAQDEQAEAQAEQLYQLKIKLPHAPHVVDMVASPHETVHDIRQSIIELPYTSDNTCFHLEYNGQTINDFSEIGDIEGLSHENTEIVLIEDPYTEKDARIHFTRVKDLLAGPAAAKNAGFAGAAGISAGISLFETIDLEVKEGKPHAMTGYEIDAPAKLSEFIPAPDARKGNGVPKAVQGLAISAWNPPPAPYRMKGHLLYLQVATLEGEQYQITGHVGGFYVNKSSNNKFDPSPKSAHKDNYAHSLITLLGQLSPKFKKEFAKIQELTQSCDPLATVPMTNAIPASPWLVHPEQHTSDSTRPQEAFLTAGTDNLDSLRDWNEEIQSTRELPRANVQERVLRERLLAKAHADFADAAARGAMAVVKGEVQALNPLEDTDAQMFVYNSIFFSRGYDGVGTFAKEGGDDAARAAVGKDVAGVRLYNMMDVNGLCVLGTAVVDYMGERIVAQSVVPGIFRQREEGDSQIIYGGVDGKDVVAEDASFEPMFQEVAKALHIKTHPVWDKEGKRHDLAASVETKGLAGCDGRRYVLDLYRLTPLDIEFLEEACPKTFEEGAEAEEGKDYPHRMTTLRAELIETFWEGKLKAWVQVEVEKKKAAKATEEPEKTEEAAEPKEEKAEAAEGEETEEAEEKKPEPQERIDISGFEYSLNPDAFSGQVPQTEEENAQLEKDEVEVRAASKFLREEVIPGIISDFKEGLIAAPLDGPALSRMMHKRGINMRYLGKVYELTATNDKKLKAVRQLAAQEMVARATKHVFNSVLRGLPAPLVSSAVAHVLNCLVGFKLNAKPEAVVDAGLKAIYKNTDLGFTALSVESIRARITEQTLRRFRANTFDVNAWFETDMRPVQLLRDVALKMGFQLKAQDYEFAPVEKKAEVPKANGAATPENTSATRSNGSAGKKSKAEKKAAQIAAQAAAAAAAAEAARQTAQRKVTFLPEDLVNVVPVVKEASPKSSLAEEALEAGRMSIIQGNRDLGVELLLESLSLHEQIYGVLHPEVARGYNSLAMIYHQLEEKALACELARKAVIVAERSLGVDSSETILNYLNLALFEHSNGNSQVALALIKHAFTYWKVAYGEGHPDSVTTMNNVAVMLQSVKEYKDSLTWFEASLRVCEELFGEKSINTATLSFQLSQALALVQDAKGAVQKMRDAYNVFKEELGPEDKNTKETEFWLEQLTQNAVNIAKAAKQRASLPPRVFLNAQPQQQAQQQIKEKASRGPRGTENLDDLVNYINGAQSSASKKTKKKSKST
ncbi:putative eukaryotic translation initiation factor 3 subunit CLU1/TIF31 [Saitoella complicata NRRL Y-17804]|uniref:putative eukaryotic translation initiation factor 3 subunit CLU1/TIF31 n=1 Tax=Saitoella complicata (strain BCRC 22490 / CBS 7301 / JCM 7358 / NBRC 10748 / NRRL Y-17804) TaxID=698492 RepID=UPI0008670908|nr:putative eukaryotic translation initiation factor 3 subunit CLU1/TIF31 [Saitoella complicata NRRL Y-17804]ODQ50882.1 putative eukaryotic translation initiation factor 3 subunit CLU1/TIF31 [Saitoella complicata NRRL Y-17804]